MSRRIGLLAWLAALALGLRAEAVAYSWGQPRLWVADLVVGLTFIACGGLAWDRHRGAAALFAATGITWFAGTAFAELAFVHRGPLANLLLAYPGARPRSRIDGAGVAGAYLVAPAGESDALAVVFALMLVTLAGRGFLGATGRERRERRTALLATVPFAAVLIGGAIDAHLLVYEIVLLGIAVGLSAGLRRPAAATVADLVVELGETRSGLLGDRLAHALGDPTLVVGYWLGEAGAYVNDAGRPLALPEAQTVMRIEREGRPFAVIVHDAAVLEDPVLVEAVASAARLTAANVELQAERRARASELSASRRRLLVAADRERRSLEERLRRGPEARLVEVDALLAPFVADGAGAHVECARRALARTLVDLHELASGLHPRELADAGLLGALAALAARAPLPVGLEVTGERLPGEIEAAVYFVCAEALANVAKYANASRAWVSVERTAGGVVLCVADDGIGGADRAGGTGLQGLADRVEALGGRLLLESPAGEGTRVSAAIPLR